MISTIAFFVLICVLVFVHEYGHFWAARRCGVKVLRFSIGFGKVLWRKKDRHGTEFVLSLIPLGGYVKMYNGGDEKFSHNQALSSKSVLQRAFIIVAGPLANFLFAIFAYWLVFMAGIPSLKPVVGEVIPNTIAAQAKMLPELEIKRIDGQAVQDWEDAALALVGKVGEKNVVVEGTLIDETFPRQFSLDLSRWEIDTNQQNPLTLLGIEPKRGVVKPTLRVVAENSAAAKAGLRVGDKILTVNAQPFDWHFLVQQIQLGDELILEIERDGEYKRFSVIPEKLAQGYQIGIKPHYQELEDKYHAHLNYDMLTAFEKALYKVGSLIRITLQFIGNLISGDLSINNIGGPLSMAKGAGSTAEMGFVYYLSFMALISVNLGVMNLFPILPLDGGQLVLLGAEALYRKPLPEKIQLRFQQVGIIFVISLMAFALFNDVIHF